MEISTMFSITPLQMDSIHVLLLKILNFRDGRGFCWLLQSKANSRFQENGCTIALKIRSKDL
ncbi:hypothetical protein H5410_041954 [Solanum commersonii]|uniref:Uncharacterized protein n=1 Tax=Solanum commersonii TaxID=4109 RepID=A0A9J5XW63_SOLCO|nr:hypothetical protein H5410_041954 [Solanum commersonii]